MATQGEIRPDTEKIHQIDDRRWVLSFALILMTITTLPYIIGYYRQGVDYRFTGFVIGVEDGNSYVAKMLLGSAGAWLFRTPYSIHHQSGMLAYLPYILLGKLAAPPALHEQLVVLFHLFRFIAGVLAIWATYGFYKLFILEMHWRRLALVIAAIGGGLGWLLLLLGEKSWMGSLPLEFYSPESFGFLELFTLPHLSLGRALLLWGLSNYITDHQNGQMNLILAKQAFNRISVPRGVWTGVLWNILGLMQPLTILIGWSILVTHCSITGGWQLWQQWRRLMTDWTSWKVFTRHATWVIGLTLPLVLYNFFKFQYDPFLRQWLAQNIILSPSIGHYILAYGVMMPFVFVGIHKMLRNNWWQGWLPVGWLIILPVLAYAPHNLQRRLVEGAWVIIIMLAVKGIEGITNLKIYKWVKPSFWLASLMIIPSTIFLIAGSFQATWQPGQPAFRPVAQVRAFQYLAEHAKSGSIILAGYETSNALPAWAPLRVVIGHGPESVGLTILQSKVWQIYQAGTLESTRQNLFSELNVDYVFWGAEERLLGSWDVSAASNLRQVYNQEGYAIFQVIKNPEE